MGFLVVKSHVEVRFEEVGKSAVLVEVGHFIPSC